MPCCRWGLARPKQLSMAATARVIWLCACVRYWPDRGLVFECVTCYYCSFSYLDSPCKGVLPFPGLQTKPTLLHSLSMKWLWERAFLPVDRILSSFLVGERHCISKAVSCLKTKHLDHGTQTVNLNGTFMGFMLMSVYRNYSVSDTVLEHESWARNTRWLE